jgi:hypothetical protein
MPTPGPGQPCQAPAVIGATAECGETIASTSTINGGPKMSSDTPQGKLNLVRKQGRAWIDQVAGVRIGYTVTGPSAGTTRTVLLIHGAPQTGYAWREVVPLLAEAGYQVVVTTVAPAPPANPATATTNGPWPPISITSSTPSWASKARSR